MERVHMPKSVSPSNRGPHSVQRAEVLSDGAGPYSSRSGMEGSG
jgi:hypothetical protein